MLFNSFEFLLGFLPAALVGYVVALRISSPAARAWLVIASLCFYSWWDIRYTPLLVLSTCMNYLFGLLISACRDAGRIKQATLVTALGIATNLLVLGFFKYAAFVVSIFSGSTFIPSTHTIPLGISFFTFTQIAYLADTRAAKARERDPVSYMLFVTWFPHLIAGPLLHHREMMSQFSGRLRDRLATPLVAAGLTMFAIGLFKKVILADGIGAYVAPSNALAIFSKATTGSAIGFAEGWLGTLAYTLQLYFDFSGYSDMAIGLSALFGIKLPLNFDSPYKAASVSEFWRRWHMTLSRFLRDYLYIPLGGNRRHRSANLMITMVLGGIWHGAGWTFVVWGALHGVYLVTNVLWNSAKTAVFGDRNFGRPGRVLGRTLTFLAVAIGWVFFRADNLPSAIAILRGISGLNGFATIGMTQPHVPLVLWTIPLLLIVWFAPNSQEIMARVPIWLDIRRDPTRVQPRGVLWRPTLAWSLAMSTIFVIAILGLTRPTQFLYFQF